MNKQFLKNLQPFQSWVFCECVAFEFPDDRPKTQQHTHTHKNEKRRKDKYMNDKRNKQACQVHPTTESRQRCEFIMRHISVSPKALKMNNIVNKQEMGGSNKQRLKKVQSVEIRWE